MAQKMQNEEGSAGAGHNSGDRRPLIKDVGDKMRAIKAERKKLNEQMAEQRKRLKDADVNVKAVESALRTADLEEEARASFAEWLRVAHEVYGVSEQTEMDLGDQEAA